MKSSIDHVYRSATRPKDSQLNIVYFPYNGLFEQCLVGSKHRYFTCRSDSVHKWNNHFLNPHNFVEIPNDISRIPNYIEIDLVICNKKTKQRKAFALSNALHAPLMIIDHEPPNDKVKDVILHQLERSMPVAKRVITSPLVNKRWGIDNPEIIPYGFFVLPKKLPKKTLEVTIAGDFLLEDYGVIKSLLDIYPNIKLLGDNPGLTESLDYIDMEQLTSYLLQSKIYINVSPEGLPPLHMIHAMTCGCAIVTNKTYWTESIIKDGKNGIIVDDIDDIQSGLQRIVHNNVEIERLQKAAKDSAKEIFSPTDFTNQFDKAASEAAESIYKR